MKIPNKITPSFVKQFDEIVQKHLLPGMKVIRRMFPLYTVMDRPVEAFSVDDNYMTTTLRLPNLPSTIKYQVVGDTYHLFVSQRFYINDKQLLVRRRDEDPPHWVDLADTTVLSNSAEQARLPPEQRHSEVMEWKGDQIMRDFYNNFYKYRLLLEANVDDQVLKAFLYKTQRTPGALQLAANKGVVLIGEVPKSDPQSSVILHGSLTDHIVSFVADLCPTCHKTKKP